jgi:DNA-binding GntR family transcriptional regulator
MQIKSNLTLAETVANEIRIAILVGELKDGEKVVEQKLAEKYKVSRVPVREAIRQLEMEGFIERVNFSSTRVKPINSSALQEVHQLYIAISKLILPDAIVNYTEDYYPELEQYIAEIENAQDFKTFVLKVWQYAEAVHAPCQKEFSLRVLREIYFTHLRIANVMYSEDFNPSPKLDIHREYIRLCREGKVEEAVQNRLNYIAWIAEILTNKLES